MFVFGNFFEALAAVVGYALEILKWLIIIRALLSWVSPDPYNPIVRFLYQATTPVFHYVRRFIPRSLFRTGLDLTPILVFILLIIIDTTLVGLLFEWSEILLSK